jgi:galactitol-specific phosphotransferase system IIB component
MPGVKARRLIFLALLLIAALTLAACGGGGGSSDEGEIEEAIEKVATTNAVSNCTKLETQRFVEQNADQKGPEAVETCEAEAKEEAEQAEGATVSNISVDGEKATAEVEFEGGPLGAQVLNVSLADEEGWKLDHIDGFAKYDGKAIAAGFEKNFEEEPEELPASVAKCVAEGFEGASTAEAEEFFLSGSSKPIEELAEGCAS